MSLACTKMVPDATPARWAIACVLVSSKPAAVGGIHASCGNEFQGALTLEPSTVLANAAGFSDIQYRAASQSNA